MVPVLVQLPVAVVGALSDRYREARRERSRMRRAFSYHLPETVVDQLTDNLDAMGQVGKLMWGVCLATDAEHYTQLAEPRGPEAVRDLMNRYYETLFAPIRARGGIVTDVVGDASMSVWRENGARHELRRAACLSALEVASAVDRFNRTMHGLELPTRFGLCCGEFVLGLVGAVDHYEYRAVGDTVNTAARIEGLNKHLGTRLLATREVVEGLDDLVVRELGRFRLAGKRQTVTICELVAARTDVTPRLTARLRAFSDAMQAFWDRDWAEARERLEGFVRVYNDEAAHFYLRLCRGYAVQPPPADWDGVIEVAVK
jgi:adenylate cyclase